MILTPKKIEKYADVLIWGLENARKGGKVPRYDVVRVAFDLAALPLAEVLHRKLVRKRFHVVMRALGSPGMEKNFFTYADDKQLAYCGKYDYAFAETINGHIYLNAPTSLTHMKSVDPRKIGKAAVARKPLRDIMEKREEAGRFSWTLCTYPTAELAKQAGMSLKKYAEQIERACFLNLPDPVKKWKWVRRQSRDIKRWLNSMKIDTFRLESRSMDLKIRYGEKRRFIGVDGHNIPSFEIFTSPDWRGTEGVYYSDLPSYRDGNYVEKVRLEFKKGRAVKITAAKGEAYVRACLKMDKGACQLGEFSLTDRRFSKIDRFMADTLFDENFGGKNGNCHLAVGSSYSDTFDGNPKKLTKAYKRKLGYNDSSLHWDLVNTEDKRVTAKLKNGKTVTLYEGGQFKH